VGPVPHKAATYEEFFSWGSRHHCPMEVGSYGQKRPLCIQFTVDLLTGKQLLGIIVAVAAADDVSADDVAAVHQTTSSESHRCAQAQRVWWLLCTRHEQHSIVVILRHYIVLFL